MEESKGGEIIENDGEIKKRGKLRIRIVHGKRRDEVSIKTKLKQSLLSQSNSSSFVDSQLQHFFTSFSIRTPTHPPYASMIKRVIKKSGSTEEEISELIRKEFEGLPFAHDLILVRHLKELCSDGEIMYTPIGRRYLPVVDDVNTQQQDSDSDSEEDSEEQEPQIKEVTYNNAGPFPPQTCVMDPGDANASATAFNFKPSAIRRISQGPLHGSESDPIRSAPSLSGATGSTSAGKQIRGILPNSEASMKEYNSNRLDPVFTSFY